MHLYDYYVQQELNKLKQLHTIFEINISKLLALENIALKQPRIILPREKSTLTESHIKIKHLHKNRLVALITLTKNSKFTLSDPNTLLHVIVLFGEFKLNGKRYFAQDHIVLYNSTLIETEFVYLQIITKFNAVDPQ
eukprot:NODE_303_length_10328_cov_1.228077.p9 type:complete len:137 gc:universal NODE_303_length_10328_cov_1.228077:9853-9443(-)